jgi:tRNA (guanine-N(7)-)-methyltransferase (EC 2.1.1.33)
MRRSCMNPMWK